MRKYRNIIIILAITTLSACNSGQEKIKTNQNTSIEMNHQSNIDEIHHIYSKLSNNLSGKLKVALQENQRDWNRKTSEICDKNIQEKERRQCYIIENKNRLKILTRHQDYLANLVDKKLSGLEKVNGEYIGGFDSYCMCSAIIPFIDTKSNTMILESSCDELISEYPISRVILSDDWVRFVMIHENKLEYYLTFKYDKNQTYTIATSGTYAMTKTMHFPSYFANQKQYPINTDLICGDFDG